MRKKTLGMGKNPLHDKNRVPMKRWEKTWKPIVVFPHALHTRPRAHSTIAAVWLITFIIQPQNNVGEEWPVGGEVADATLHKSSQSAWQWLTSKGEG